MEVAFESWVKQVFIAINDVLTLVVSKVNLFSVKMGVGIIVTTNADFSNTIFHVNVVVSFCGFGMQNRNQINQCNQTFNSEARKSIHRLSDLPRFFGCNHCYESRNYLMGDHGSSCPAIFCGNFHLRGRTFFVAVVVISISILFLDIGQLMSIKHTVVSALFC